jgi:hypothetical protein
MNKSLSLLFYYYFVPDVFLIHLKKCHFITNYLARQAKYIYYNGETHLCNHCYSGEAIGITYSECVFEVLGILHAMHMHHIVLCGLSGCTAFFSITS